MGLLGVLLRHRGQHLTDHWITAQRRRNLLGLLHHLGAYRGEASSFGCCAIGGASLGVTRDRAEHRKALLKQKRWCQQRVHQVAFDHVAAGFKRHRLRAKAMPPGLHRAGNSRLERRRRPGRMGVIFAGLHLINTQLGLTIPSTSR